MTATAPAQPRFVRRTCLGPGEYRKNFRQIDGDVIAAITSEEADRVTPLMSKIYLRLVHAPAEYWERDGVLRFEGKPRDGGQVTAWETLYEAAGVASATARKAILWMHEQGIIGYFASKNGVGIRVFINYASSSIGSRAGKKILGFRRASSEGARTSPDEAAFSDSFADPESLDKDLNPRAPKDGAEATEVVKRYPDPQPARSRSHPQGVRSESVPSQQTAARVEVPVEEIVSRLRHELEPSLQSAARQAAAREHERTREWLESRGLPKAARVAQREAFNVLRQHGVVSAANKHASAAIGVGRQGQDPPAAKALTPDEVREVAESCVAMLEARGQAIDVTLSEISSEAGGFLLPADAPRVRELAEMIARGGESEESHRVKSLAASRTPTRALLPVRAD